MITTRLVDVDGHHSMRTLGLARQRHVVLGHPAAGVE